ncbi:hypothetical protein AB0C96_32175 [Streptomyces sp. NPDC048506]|uniref:hypothetical protein n=1 Tax=Streptomyces sp. NPDC048506 TaxID=3155028 RepID=UPI00343154B5
MHNNKIITGVAVAAAALLLTACSGGSAPSSSPEAVAPAPSVAPSPDATQREELYRALEAIDRGYVRRTGPAQRHSMEVCADIVAGKDPATTAKNAEASFRGIQEEESGPDRGQKIVDAVKRTFCH